jgi:serine/threonine protein kinase
MVHASSSVVQIGEVLSGRYRLQRVIGEGASSWVFAARDLRLERDVAVKLFKICNSSDDVKRRRRCIAEGRTLAKLVHPHIVSVHDAIEDEAGLAYLVVELCEAGTLEDEVVQSGRLQPLETLQLVLPLLGALALAHDRNVIHRDIKPSNIVLLEQNGKRRCKVLDFGISLGLGASSASDHGLGTPSFMAPEQARGEPPSIASDVWALGVVLFYCLSGELPFQGSNAAAVLHKLGQQRAPRFASVCSQLGPHLALALDRALEPNLTRRYPNMRAFARALAAACALDRVPVALQPDPVGLPDFADWVAAAAGQNTEPLPTGERTLSSALGKRSAWRRAAKATLLGLMALASATAWSSLGAQRARLRATHERNPSPPAASATAAPLVVPGSLVSQVLSGPPAPVPEPEAAACFAQAPVIERPKRAEDRKAKSRRPKAEAPQRRLIMRWDW